MTYALHSPADLDPLLQHLIATAGDVITLRDGRSFPIGIPLCSGCDGALDDEGFCADCQEPAHWRDTIRQALLPPRPVTARFCMERTPEEMTTDIHRIAKGA